MHILHFDLNHHFWHLDMLSFHPGTLTPLSGCCFVYIYVFGCNNCSTPHPVFVTMLFFHVFVNVTAKIPSVTKSEDILR